GRDTLTGGRDDDTFLFTRAQQSQNTNQQDRITDFSQGEDMIDLSRLTQDPLVFIDTGFFSSTGQAEVRVSNLAGDGIIRVDVDGDGIADMKIKVTGFFDFADTDFLL
ncbi:MAG: Ca2+-binding RTX toxin-like protein, partial [Paracoccaceae bacterium]